MTDTSLSRRDFLTRTALGASAATLLPRDVVGGPDHIAPSDTVRVGCIGIGGKGAVDVRGVDDAEGTEIVALCDVDRERGKEMFNAYPDAAHYEDYREMLGRESSRLDAVTVSTPDHNHALPTLLALKEGLNVFCQKPLTHTVTEARRVADAAEQADVATAMGIQFHSAHTLPRLREFLEAGVIGSVNQVHAWTNRPVWPQSKERPLEVYHEPDHLNWDLWLGPAPERPYHPAYAPFDWRGWHDFGTGALGDMGCHLLDGAFWALELEPPTRVRAESTPTYDETYPDVSRVRYEVPRDNGSSDLEIVWLDGNLRPPKPAAWNEDKPWPPDNYNQLFWGEDGVLLYGLGQPPLVLPKKKHEAVMANPPEKTYDRSPGVYEEWIQACRGGDTTGTDFAGYAAPLTELVLLGTVAVQAQRPVEWDTDAGSITNAPALNDLLDTDYRDGWAV